MNETNSRRFEEKERREKKSKKLRKMAAEHLQLKMTTRNDDEFLRLKLPTSGDDVSSIVNCFAYTLITWGGEIANLTCSPLARRARSMSAYHTFEQS